ncbi:hypothetical protein ILUMI_26994 [Ignelater luminosus]|uniref:RUN domain-containing protein n=1 Tax=Ignelater luminosus TaxID=2038154 RepID=A0A8K0C5S6_IGNLU|nr:hypothetical protein ILUMI_26994 [Ignelater luminosus]
MEEVSDEVLTGKRWDPSGASNDEDTSNSAVKKYECCERSLCIHASEKYEEKLKSLEEEQELLNSSLCALTSHFAQVQFRLRQAVAAPYQDKESLLKSLEEFAFRGIPDVGIMRERMDEASIVEAIWLRRAQQQRLIERLKSQINELEKSLHTNDERDVYDMLENQQINFNEFQLPMNLEYDKQRCYIKQQFDAALNKLRTPLKMKEQLVTQLKIQVADLERFIQHLQNNNNNYNNDNKVDSICKCGCVLNTSTKKPLKTKDTMNIIKRLATFLHMFSLLYLGYSPQYYNKGSLNHWGDLRARLEIAIAKVLEAIKTSETDEISEQQSYTSNNESFYVVNNIKVTTAVRKYLATCIRDLMQHGACKEIPVYRLVPFINCFKQKFKASESPIHAWEIVLKYYHLKNGEQFNSSPTTKLSQSFDLDITGESGKSNKHNILFAIGNIISTHSLYKQNYDYHFKAFICAGLNANKLVAWLGMIFQCRSLLEMHYHSWSYVRKTGFSDSLDSLEALTNIKFNLPVNLEIYRLQNGDDAFI